MDEELSQLQTEYLRGLPEKIDLIYELLLNLEKNIETNSTLTNLKGIIHSIKGTSGSYEMTFLSDLCHKFEDQIESLEEGKSQISKSFLFIDLMREYLENFTPGEETDLSTLDVKLKLLSGENKEIKKNPDIKKKIIVISHDQFIEDAISLALSKQNLEKILIKKPEDLKGKDDVEMIFIDESAKNYLNYLSPIKPKKIIFLKSKDNVLLLEKKITPLEKSYKLIRDIKKEFFENPKKELFNSILIVDDDESLHPLFKKGLKDFKLKILSSSKEALKYLEKEKVDLILLDWMMPELNGKQLLEEIRKNGIQIPIIFLTGLSKPEEIQELKRLDAQGVITKPFKLSELSGQVMEIWYKA